MTDDFEECWDDLHPAIEEQPVEAPSVSGFLEEAKLRRRQALLEAARLQRGPTRQELEASLAEAQQREQDLRTSLELTRQMVATEPPPRRKVKFEFPTRFALFIVMFTAFLLGYHLH